MSTDQETGVSPDDVRDALDSIDDDATVTDVTVTDEGVTVETEKTELERLADKAREVLPDAVDVKVLGRVVNVYPRSTTIYTHRWEDVAEVGLDFSFSESGRIALVPRGSDYNHVDQWARGPADDE